MSSTVQGNAATSAPDSFIGAATPWGSLLLAICAGMLAAFQVGKVHIALPSIRQSFSLSLFSASWILSALSVVGLFLAAPAGSFAARIGAKRALVLGLILIAAASAAGAAAPTPALLLVSRLLEGIGYVIVVVAAPSLIVEIARPADLKLALSAWATFMPGGIALITVLAPFLLAAHTWRALWIANAALICVYAFILFIAVKISPVAAQRGKEMNPFVELRVLLTSRGPMMLALIFAMYTLQHLGIMGFMPTFLIERFGVTHANAGILVSIVMASNILGNLSAGFLLQRGVRRSTLIGAVSVFMSAMAIGIFSLGLPLVPVFVCAFLFSCVGGIIPATVLSAAPYHAPSASLIPATNGLLVQGSNLGIVLGPPLLSSIAVNVGWSWVPVAIVAASLTAITFAFLIHRTTLSRNEPFYDGPVH